MVDAETYLTALRQAFANGDATEHTHRAALSGYFESYAEDLVATNEPKRVAAGAPDYNVGRQRAHGVLSIGKVEAKDIGVNLDAVHTDSERANPRTREGKQLRRYRAAFDNLILTDYVTFKWYRRGDLRTTASLGTVTGHSITDAADNGAAVEALVKDFLANDRIQLRSARQLAVRMARLTHLMREVALAGITNHTVSASTLNLQKAFREVLVADLTDDAFADMFCQTIAYGLFAARVRHDETTGPFTRAQAAGEIPRTNPFLRSLFALVTGPDLNDEPFAGFVEDLVQLLDDTDMTRVLRDFGNETRRDPIVHFYETFLGEYDPRLRDVRGVYYTPMPVVSYITRSVDELLTRDFAIPDGLADTSTLDGSDNHKVLVLDPATGTSTFLYEVIDLVRARIKASGIGGAWPSYVREHLLPRLFGFEIMMAPYAVAHLKLGLQLAGADLPENERAAWAYDFAHDDRVGVYLTNALDPGEAKTDILMGQFISDEANAASHVKIDLPIMVVLGNPPYQGQSMNASEKWVLGKGKKRTKVRTFIGELLQTYYDVDGTPLGEQNPKWLQDDYVKFIRLGQWRIDQTGQGVLAFVTNHTYLDAPTFRGMREKLLRSFDDIYIIDLHGSIRRREQNPHGGSDENVFDQIQQGVAIAIFVKRTASTDLGTVHHAEQWGSRDAKYTWLNGNTVGSTSWTSLTPAGPFYGFHPEDADLAAEWEQGISLIDIFPTYSTGIVTHRDDLVVDTNPTRLRNRIAAFLDPTKSDDAVRAQFFGTTGRTNASGIYYPPGDNRDWAMATKRAALIADTNRDAAFRTVQFRPLDDRAIFYHPDAIDGYKYDVMHHMLDGPNIGLVSARSNKSPVQDQFLVSTSMTEVKTGEATTGSVLFPLWLYTEAEAGDGEDALLSKTAVAGSRKANISDRFTTLLNERLNLTLIDDDHGDLNSTVGPRDVLNYVYAVVNSRNYRVRYGDFLRRDYAHIPLTSDLDLFRELCGLGAKLTAVTTFTDPTVQTDLPGFPVGGTSEITAGFPRYVAAGDTPPGSDDTATTEGRVYINADGATDKTGQFFQGITPEAWEFTIGGHQVLEKWLRSRRGDRLSFDEIKRFSRVAKAVTVLIETQDLVEEAITTWPLP